MNYSGDKKFIKSLSHLHFNSWETYSSVIKSLLWLEVRSLYLKNKNVLEKMDSYCPGNFPIFLIGDITGYYPNISGKDLLELIGESQPERLNNIESLIEMLPQKVITYSLLDEFLNQSQTNLPNIRLKKASEISSIGYCLFWFANREIYIDQNVLSFPNKLPIQNDLLDPLLNLAVGIQSQRWDHLYKEYYPTLIKMIKKNFGIVYLRENDNEYKAEYLFNMYNSESAGDQFSNDSIMAVIGALRRVDINRVKYSAKLIGDEIHSDIDIPEIKKNIKSEKLYWLWITEINSWHTKLHDYDLYSEKWSDVDKLLKICISKNSEIFKMLLSVFNRLYKKGNLNGIDFTDMINKINDLMNILNNSHLFYPKNSVDKYGINNDSYSLDPNEYRNRNNNEDSLGFQNQNQSRSDFSSIHREYCQKLVAFYENMHVLLGEKIRKEAISHKSRVSYISLMEACELFSKLNAKYNDEFPLSTKEIISKNDLTEFRQVSSVWSHLFLNEIRIDRSFVYDRKEYFKRYQNRIASFLNSEIKKIEGVINCVRIDSHYQIVVDVAQNDDFFTALYYQFKNDFPEIEIMTFENSLWTDAFEYIEFKYSVKGFDIPPIYKIESKKFAFLEASKLKTSLMACQTNKGVNVSNELLKNFLGYNTGLGDFSFYINHINDVFRSIDSSLYKEYFEIDIFSCWADKTKRFGQNLIYSIDQSVKQVNDYLTSVFGDDDNNSNIMNEITDGIKHLEKEVQVILDNRSLTDSDSFLKSLERTFVKLQNSIQKFTADNNTKIQLCLEQIC